jgi:predicted permease
MALMIAEALVPVFFVMFLGYLAGTRRVIDNRHVASLNVLVMTFALPAALFVGVANVAPADWKKMESLSWCWLFPC